MTNAVWNVDWRIFPRADVRLKSVIDRASSEPATSANHPLRTLPAPTSVAR